MRTVKCRFQLLADHVNELPQRGESAAVENLNGNYVDGRAERSVPRVEHRAATAGVMEAEQPHGFTRLQDASVRSESSSASAFTVYLICSSEWQLVTKNRSRALSSGTAG